MWITHFLILINQILYSQEYKKMNRNDLARFSRLYTQTFFNKGLFGLHIRQTNFIKKLDSKFLYDYFISIYLFVVLKRFCPVYFETINIFYIKNQKQFWWLVMTVFYTIKPEMLSIVSGSTGLFFVWKVMAILLNMYYKFDLI